MSNDTSSLWQWENNTLFDGREIHWPVSSKHWENLVWGYLVIWECILLVIEYETRGYTVTKSK